MTKATTTVSLRCSHIGHTKGCSPTPATCTTPNDAHMQMGCPCCTKCQRHHCRGNGAPTDASLPRCAANPAANPNAWDWYLRRRQCPMQRPSGLHIHIHTAQALASWPMASEVASVSPCKTTIYLSLFVIPSPDLHTGQNGKFVIASLLASINQTLRLPPLSKLSHSLHLQYSRCCPAHQ